MTVITEEDMSEAVLWLASDTEAETLYFLTKAENESKRAWARAYLASNQKSVEAKKASAELHPDVIDAKDHWAECIKDHKEAQGRTNWANKVTEIWRSENKNARQVETVF